MAETKPYPVFTTTQRLAGFLRDYRQLAQRSSLAVADVKNIIPGPVLLEQVTPDLVRQVIGGFPDVVDIDFDRMADVIVDEARLQYVQGGWKFDQGISSKVYAAAALKLGSSVQSASLKLHRFAIILNTMDLLAFDLRKTRARAAGFGTDHIDHYPYESQYPDEMRISANYDPVRKEIAQLTKQQLLEQRNNPAAEIDLFTQLMHHFPNLAIGLDETQLLLTDSSYPFFTSKTPGKRKELEEPGEQKFRREVWRLLAYSLQNHLSTYRQPPSLRTIPVWGPSHGKPTEEHYWDKQAIKPVITWFLNVTSRFREGIDDHFNYRGIYSLVQHHVDTASFMGGIHDLLADPESTTMLTAYQRRELGSEFKSLERWSSQPHRLRIEGCEYYDYSNVVREEDKRFLEMYFGGKA